MIIEQITNTDSARNEWKRVITYAGWKLVGEVQRCG